MKFKTKIDVTKLSEKQRGDATRTWIKICMQHLEKANETSKVLESKRPPEHNWLLPTE